MAAIGAIRRGDVFVIVATQRRRVPTQPGQRRRRRAHRAGRSGDPGRRHGAVPVPVAAVEARRLAAHGGRGDGRGRRLGDRRPRPRPSRAAQWSAGRSPRRSGSHPRVRSSPSTPTPVVCAATAASCSAVSCCRSTSASWPSPATSPGAVPRSPRSASSPGWRSPGSGNVASSSCSVRRRHLGPSCARPRRGGVRLALRLGLVRPQGSRSAQPTLAELAWSDLLGLAPRTSASCSRRRPRVAAVCAVDAPRHGDARRRRGRRPAVLRPSATTAAVP